MTKQEFYSLSYQEQFYHLIDYIYKKYNHDPYLYYALHIITQGYEHHESFGNSYFKDLDYNFI